MSKLLYFPILPEKSELGSERADFVQNWIDNQLINCTTNEEEANAYLVGGGDGFMMRAARMKYNSNKPMFGINCGTKGFLLNQIKQFNHVPTDSNELQLITLNLIQATFIGMDNSRTQFLAFNDVVIGGNIADYITFDIKGKLNHFQSRTVSGNGIVVATPQGTTAFSLCSKGSGAVLPLDTKAWFINGVATGPYPNNIVIPQTIEISASSRYPVHGYADGYQQEVKNIKKVIINPTDNKITIAFLKGDDFESRRRNIAIAYERGEH